ncbi:MAG TPA: winged helix-turn-helix domain-containing protein [Pyrinomonadaceae bacterium]|nr:winged helix-turn-helix domain-containing protein [Pyrinomonadaceae bacterium]
MIGEENGSYEFGHFYLDGVRRCLLKNGQPVHLTTKAFEVLLLLIQNGGQIVEKETFMSVVWPNSFVEESNLTVSISMLRKALGDNHGTHRYVETVSGRGYRFAARVRSVSGDEGTLREALTLAESSNNGRADSPEVAPCVLAILPLTNAGNEQHLEPVVDGLTENIINALSQLPHLRVLARDTVFRYKDRAVDAQPAGRELGARAVLRGSAVRLNKTLVISVELIDVEDGTQIWSAQYKRPLSSILTTQTELAQALAAALCLKLTGEEKRRLAKRYTHNTDAYNLYLKGRYFWNKYAAKFVKKGIEYFQQAIEIDSSYALAYAGVADCYFRLSAVHLHPKEALPKASAAAHKAVEIDDSLAEAHVSLAMIKVWYDYDWPGAEQEFRRALEINPGAPLARQRYGEYLMFMERFDEALEELQLAQTLDPLSLWIGVSLGTNLYLMGRHEEAIKQLQNVLEMEPHYYPARFCLGMIYLQQRRHARAIAEFQRAQEIEADSSFASGFIGYAYAISGEREKAEKILKALLEKPSGVYVSPYSIALINVGLEEKGQAFKWLEELYEDHNEWILWLRVAPEFEGLRADPRFTGLLKRIGL